MNVTLPGGGTAVLRDPRSMPAKYADIIADAQMDIALSGAASAFGGEATTQAEADALASEFEKLPAVEQMRRYGKEGIHAFRAYGRSVVLALVESWSFGPVTETVMLEEIPGDVLTALEAECTKVMKATGGPDLDVAPQLVDGQLVENPSEPSSD